MMKEEFEKMLGNSVNYEDYYAIEYVYTFHPAIKSKKDIVDLYKIGGMLLIADMYPSAKTAQNFEEKIFKLRSELANVVEEYEDFKRGDLT